MATNRIAAQYSSPATTFYLDADHIQSDEVNGRWLVRFYLRANNGPGGTTSSQYNGSGVQVGYYAGNEFGRHSGSPFLPSGVPNGGQRWSNGPWDVWIYGRSAWTMGLSMLLQYGNINSTTYGSIPLPALANVPNAPGAPTASEVTPTSMRISWTLPSNNGATLDQILLRRSSTPDFASYTDIVLGGSATTQVVTGLSPASTYYWRVYAHNRVGYSAPSPTLTRATAPATAPSFAVIPNLTGTGVSIYPTPPAGTADVTKYTVESRPQGSGTVTSTDFSTSPLVISGLTPGSTYEYRISAWFDAYQTPWSDWTALRQPNPNTSPGNYFDGSSQATTDQTFAWTGTTNLSTSVANGIRALGWAVATTAGGSPILQRITGGMAGQYAARMIVRSDATGAGLFLGMDFTDAARRAEVVERTLYHGSIYVRPSRIQSLVAEMVWLDATGVEISRVWGNAQPVNPGVWTRLTVSETSPIGAVAAIVRARDVAGTGFSPWLGGETLDADAAMITLGDLYPFFDGSTPDTVQYAYTWLGTVNDSVSMREALSGDQTDALVDPDCPPLPLPPAPPVIDSSCIETTGIWRRYWVVIPASEVSAWKMMIPTTELRTGALPIRQVRIRTHPNPFNYAPDALDLTSWCAEQIISYIPANTVFTLDGIMERAWAEVNGRPSLAADHFLYGSGGVPATWPMLSCGTPYLISLDVPLDAPESNLDIAVSLTARE